MASEGTTCHVVNGNGIKDMDAETSAAIAASNLFVEVAKRKSLHADDDAATTETHSIPTSASTVPLEQLSVDSSSATSDASTNATKSDELAPVAPIEAISSTGSSSADLPVTVTSVVNASTSTPESPLAQPVVISSAVGSSDSCEPVSSVSEITVDVATPVMDVTVSEVVVAVPVGDATLESPDVLLARGKRCLICGETQKAVLALQEACRLLAGQYGEVADECAEAYFYYGRALLELSRMESGVLGNALQGITEEEDNGEEEEKDDDKGFTEPDSLTVEEKAQISEDILDAMLEKPDTEPSGTHPGTGSGETLPATGTSEVKDGEANRVDKSLDGKPGVALAGEENKEEKQEAAAVNKVAEEVLSDKAVISETTGNGSTESTREIAEQGVSGEVEEEMDVGEGGAEDDEEEVTTEEEEEGQNKTASTEDDDEVSSLERAWEILELAKNIYRKHASGEMKLKEADCLLKLGEIGLETEQYVQSITDFEACLALHKTYLADPADRRLAETYYQLGLACSGASRYEDAVSHFRSATNIIESRVAALQGILGDEKKEGSKAGDNAGESPVSQGVAMEEESKNSVEDGVEKKKELLKELTELKDLLPEIYNKIEDAEEDRRNAGHVKEMIRDLVVDSGASMPSILLDTTTTEALPGASGPAASVFTSQSTSADNSKPINSVMHLVRRKRKPDNDEEEEESKKQRTTDSDQTVTSPPQLTNDSMIANPGSPITTPLTGLPVITEDQETVDCVNTIKDADTMDHTDTTSVIIPVTTSAAVLNGHSLIATDGTQAAVNGSLAAANGVVASVVVSCTANEHAINGASEPNGSIANGGVEENGHSEGVKSNGGGCDGDKMDEDPITATDLPVIVASKTVEQVLADSGAVSIQVDSSVGEQTDDKAMTE